MKYLKEFFATFDPLEKTIFGTILCLSFGAILWLSSTLNNFLWDSYMILNGSRAMLGWKGAWLNFSWFPLGAYLYSRLLVVTQHFHSFEIEHRADALLSGGIAIAALSAGVMWLHVLFKDKNRIFLLATCLLCLNPLFIYYASFPMMDTLGMGLGTAGVLVAFCAIQNEKNTLRYHLLAAFLIGLATTFKYHLWIGAVAILIHYFWEERRSRNLPEKINVALIYSGIGCFLFIGIHLLLWFVYGKKLNQPFNRIVHDFFEYSHMVSLGAVDPYSSFLKLLGETFGWACYLFILWGCYAGFRSNNRAERFNTIWFLSSLISMSLYQYRDRYLIHFLPSAAGVVLCGFADVVRVLPKKGKILRSVFIPLLIFPPFLSAVMKFVELNGYFYQTPVFFHIGKFVRANLPKDGKLYIQLGSASCMTFMSQNIPQDTQHSAKYTKGLMVWPINYFADFKTGDIIISNPKSNDFEYYLEIVSVDRYFPKTKTRNSIVLANSNNEQITLRKSNNRWLFEISSRPWEGWSIEMNDKTTGFLILYGHNSLPEQMVQNIHSFKRVKLSPTYFHLI